MNEYLNIFIDKEEPSFLNKYLTTKTMERIKYVNQFCGLYSKKESEIIEVFHKNFASWEKFTKVKEIVCTSVQPKNFYVSVNAKKRNVIPLVSHNGKAIRITEISKKAKEIYDALEKYKDALYGYVKEIEEV